MRILVADDDRIWRRAFEATLLNWGHYPLGCSTGIEAWQILQTPDAPRLAILDWQMPGMTGTEVCRRVRALPKAVAPYLILVTALDGAEDVVAGLDAGADDYIRKPFHHPELKARIQVGERMIALQEVLNARVNELEGALANIKQLHGLLPICAYCKRVRVDDRYWQQVEAYIGEHSEVSFSHGICPPCFEQIVEPELEQMKASAAENRISRTRGLSIDR